MILLSFFGVIFLLFYALDAGPKKDECPNFFHKWKPPRWHEGFPCHKCGELHCSDHLSSSEPWVRLEVSEDIDKALERAVNRIVDVYIREWYAAISVDDELIQEVSLVIRHVFSNLARRIVRIDLAEIISRDILSCSLRHLDASLRAEAISKSLPYGDTETTRKEFFDLPETVIHRALKSREDEAEYLLDLSALIIQYLLPPKTMRCQSIKFLMEDLLSGAVFQPIADAIPNPDIINYLILLSLDSSGGRKFCNSLESKVDFLQNFAVNLKVQPLVSTLHMDLSGILKNQGALFAFMKFLKEEKSINSLQFCLTVEDFNKRIMNPDLSNEELDILHSEAVNLFDQYLKKSSPHRVNVPQALVDEILAVLEQPVSQIIRLRTTTPLFKAYEEIYNYLETEMCPQFHKSEEYYMYLLGKRTDDQLEDSQKVGMKGWKNWFKNSLKKMSGKSLDPPIFYVSYDSTGREEEESADSSFRNEESSSSSSYIDMTRTQALTSLTDDELELCSSKSFEDLSGTFGSSVLEISKKKSKSLPKSSSLMACTGHVVECRGSDASTLRRKSSVFNSFLKPVKVMTNPIQNFLHQGSAKENGREKGTLPVLKQKDKLNKVKTKLLEDQDDNVDGALDLTDIYDEVDKGLKMSIVNDGIHEFRDLSAWRISIPRLTTVSNGSSLNKPYFVFVIDVQRIDVESKDGRGDDLHWNVKRRSSEFYALESKLTEFHGEFEDIKLPAKSKLFSGRGLDSLQAKQQPFEEYLIKLLQKPSLRESDLLYTFLTSSEEFTVAASKQDLGKMIKNVKLTKEKGQSLQPFINGFISSTLAGSPKPQLDWFLEEFDHEFDRKIKSHVIYGDNAERRLDYPPSKSKKSHFSSHSRDVQGVTDTIIFLASNVFCLQKWKLQILTSFRLIAKNSVDHLIHYGIAYKLKQVLTSSRISHLINLIEEVIFSKNSTPRREKDKIERRQSAELKLNTFLSTYLKVPFGPSNLENGTKRIFAVLQDPILNKQLFYQLLEILILKLFPEIEK